MSEFEIVDSPRSVGPAGGPQGSEPELDRRALIGIAIVLVAVVSLLMLRSGRDDGSPSIAGEAQDLEGETRGTSVSPSTTISSTASAASEGAAAGSSDTQGLGESEVEALLASFGDQVLFVGVGVDDPDQASRVYVQSIRSRERIPLGVAGHPLAVIDNWLLVEAANAVSAVDLNRLEADPVELGEPAASRPNVELIPGAVRVWFEGVKGDPVRSATYEVGSWKLVETPPDPPWWTRGHEVFSLPGSGTYRSAGDHFELISPGRLVGHNMDYLVIETCAPELTRCQLDWLERPSLERVAPVHQIGPVDDLVLLPRGGIVDFGLKIIDIVDGGSGLTPADGEGLDHIIARSETATLVARGSRVFLVEAETGETVAIVQLGSSLRPNNTAVSPSDYPLLEALIDG